MTNTPAAQHNIDAIRANLHATADEGTDDLSRDKDATLSRLLGTVTWPEKWGPAVIDELVEPPPAQAPKLFPERRKSLIDAISPALAAHHRTTGSIEQVLHRTRTAIGQSQAEAAALLTPVVQRLTDDSREVTPEDIRNIETTLATVEDDFARNVAAAWAAVLDLDSAVVSRSFAKSLQMAVDSPLGMVAGRDAHGASPADEERIAEFDALYQRAHELRQRNDPDTSK